MASIIKVDTIKDTSDNTLLTSSSGNVSISNDLTVDTDTLYVDSTNNRVGVKNASPTVELDVTGEAKISGDLTVDTDTLYVDSTDNYVQIGDGSARVSFLSDSNDSLQIKNGIIFESGSSATNNEILTYRSNSLILGTGASERMRIDSSGNVMFNTTDSTVYNNSTGDGLSFTASSNLLAIARAGGNNSHAFGLNKTDYVSGTADFQAFNVNGSIQGEITTTNGTTILYNGFTGTHWSRLADNSKPTILEGTILESLDEMMDWYQVEFQIETTDNEGNIQTVTKRQEYNLQDGQSVGDVITYNYNTENQDDEGNDIIQEVQATIIEDEDTKHTKCKISDTVDAKNVYGVFTGWDDNIDGVNDLYIAQTGTYVVRLNSNVTTLNKGDLIQSNGDGTGKVQADDIIRASTVAKVISSTKVEIYDDGSYIVPCTLHC